MPSTLVMHHAEDHDSLDPAEQYPVLENPGIQAWLVV